LLAALAIFEGARHWLLYGEMASRWGVGITFSLYVPRGESLRAMASSGHPLALGYLLAIAFGVWLYLRSHVISKRSQMAVTALLWLGLLAAYSRGPWIGAVGIYLAFAALSPRAFSRLFKAGGMAIIAAVLVSLSPLGDKIVAVLPFLGGRIDNQSVIYRQRLFDRSWQLIQESPFFGDAEALLKMRSLRQGQGIVDLINSYVQVLLNNGFVGLSLFLSFILIGLFKAWSTSKKSMTVDPDFGMLGASLVACILGTLLMMENGSFGTGVERLYYVLAGLAAAYAHLGRSSMNLAERDGRMR
jgi:O-antigen ligase